MKLPEEMVLDAIRQTLECDDEWFTRGVLERLVAAGFSRKKAMTEFSAVIENVLAGKYKKGGT
jgi:hypothetical protein